MTAKSGLPTPARRGGFASNFVIWIHRELSCILRGDFPQTVCQGAISMRQIFHVVFAAVAALALAHASTAAVAQATVKQIKLTEKQIQGFIAADKEMRAITDKMPSATSDKPDPKTQAALAAAAKKQGFKDFNEYEDVAANIAMIMAGIDPQTKTFLEPQLVIKKEIEDIQNDKSMPDKEKKQALDELNEALKTAERVEFPSNVDLIKKYFDKIEAVLQ
jgi:hypothetical protein